MGSLERGQSLSQIDLSIVIVSFNTRKLLLECLESIFSKEHRITLEVIVVDNASSDDSVEAVHERFPQVRLIENRDNHFFSPANNQGIAAACGRYVLVLNPDTLIKGDTLTQLVQQMDAQPEIGAATSVMYFPDGDLQRNGSRQVTFGYLVFNYTLLGKLLPAQQRTYNDWLWYREWDRRTPREIGVLPGSCIVAPRHVWQQVGGFQPEMLLYFSDDYLSRTVQKLGKKVMYLLSDGIVHYEGASSRDGTTRQEKRYRPWVTRIYFHDLLVFTRLVFGRPQQLLLALLLLPTRIGMRLKGALSG